MNTRHHRAALHLLRPTCRALIAAAGLLAPAVCHAAALERFAGGMIGMAIDAMNGDTVTLRDGTVIVASIIKENDRSVWLDIGYTIIEIPRVEVASITRGTPKAAPAPGPAPVYTPPTPAPSSTPPSPMPVYVPQPRPSGVAPGYVPPPAPPPMPAANIPRIPGYYPVSMVEVIYGGDPQPVSIARLREAPISMGVAADGGLTGLEQRVRTVDITLNQIGRGEFTQIDAAGIRVLTQSIVREFENAGVIGVACLPDPDQIEVLGTPEDLRQPGDTTLRFFVFVGVVREVRTVAVEANNPEDRRVNPDTPLHNRIRANSPLKPGDVLNREILDEYVAKMSRHPGRRVDVAVSAAGTQQGGATLDYVVSEAKSWLIYFQLSNTGTEETSEWRERFGFLSTNLTGNDDIFQVDYITASFQESHAFNVSYDFRIIDKLRMKVFGGYNVYTASDVGSQLFTFDGQGWTIGAETTYELAYAGGFFVDLFGGLRYEHTDTTQDLPGDDTVEGEGDYIVPSFGVRAERNTEASSFLGVLSFEYWANLGNSEQDLQQLGRLDPSKDWPLMRYDVGGSFYIEPLLFPVAFEEGAAGPGSVLANEFFFNLRGQYAFDQRLIPTVEQVLGGFATVRGYPESIIAGDSSVIFTAEYRLHIPPLLGFSGPSEHTSSKDFRFRPSEPWGSADWDLIFRAFLDVGRVVNSDKQVFETDDTLAGVGIGGEVQVLRYLNARLDLGFPLNSVETSEESVDVGDARLHFVLTLSY